MTYSRPLHFVTLLGSLRKGSFHATLARALPSFPSEARHQLRAGQIDQVIISASFKEAIWICN